MGIAVCQAEKKDADALARMLVQYMNMNGLSFAVKLYAGPGPLLEDFAPGRFAAVLLDAAFPEEDGVKAGGQIAGRDPQCAVIFTVRPDDALSAEWGAAGLCRLVKPVRYAGLAKALDGCKAGLRRAGA